MKSGEEKMKWSGLFLGLAILAYFPAILMLILTAWLPFLARIPTRFSLRMLAVVVTLFCLYFVLWELTKRNAGGESPAPLIIRKHTLNTVFVNTGAWGEPKEELVTYYYVWIFGATYKIPIEERMNMGRNVIGPIKRVHRMR